VGITRDEVRTVAALARLELTSDQEESLTGDLDQILDAFRKLQTLDTGTAEPMRPFDLDAAPLREDRVENLPADDAHLEQAPDRHGRLFHVPKIIE